MLRSLVSSLQKKYCAVGQYAMSCCEHQDLCYIFVTIRTLAVSRQASNLSNLNQCLCQTQKWSTLRVRIMDSWTPISASLKVRMPLGTCRPALVLRSCRLAEAFHLWETYNWDTPPPWVCKWNNFWIALKPAFTTESWHPQCHDYILPTLAC